MEAFVGRATVGFGVLLKGWICAFQPGIDVRGIRDLATVAFVADKADLALLGPPVIYGT